MAQFNCDICGVRPATVRVAVLQDGRRRFLDVCDFHYAQLTRHQRTLSPLEALFRASQQAGGAGDAPADVAAAGYENPLHGSSPDSVNYCFDGKTYGL